jgi:hypothetical protein
MHGRCCWQENCEQAFHSPPETVILSDAFVGKKERAKDPQRFSLPFMVALVRCTPLEILLSTLALAQATDQDDGLRGECASIKKQRPLLSNGLVLSF